MQYIVSAFQTKVNGIVHFRNFPNQKDRIEIQHQNLWNLIRFSLVGNIFLPGGGLKLLQKNRSAGSTSLLKNMSQSVVMKKMIYDRILCLSFRCLSASVCLCAFPHKSVFRQVLEFRIELMPWRSKRTPLQPGFIYLLSTT